jgi:hypothetical protein
MMFGLMWIWRGWLEMLILIFILSLVIVLFITIINYESWFLKSKYGAPFKCQTKLSRKIQFLLKIYFVPEVRGGSYLNISMPRNKEIFSMGYVRMSLFGMLILFGMLTLSFEASQKIDYHVINQKNMQFYNINDTITEIKRYKKNYSIIYFEKIDFPVKLDLNFKDTETLINKKADIDYYLTPIFKDVKLVSVKLNGKTLYSLVDTIKKTRNGNFFYGLLIILIGFLIPWWRYKLYQFKGVDLLIQVNKEIKKRDLSDVESLDNIEEIIGTARQKIN